jgi:uncharacterized protein (UPF0548 family)
VLTLRRPSKDALAALVESDRRKPLSYGEGLLNRVSEERGWFIDRHRETVGHGVTDFEGACEALRQWAQFHRSWAIAAQPPAPIRIGETVGYSARALGLWWSYTCRIVDTFDRTGNATSVFGFDYGTIRGHAERGEERMLVTLDRASGQVWFELFAMSRPGRWFMWFGLPFGRKMQARFRNGAAATFRKFIANQRPST